MAFYTSGSINNLFFSLKGGCQSKAETGVGRVGILQDISLAFLTIDMIGVQLNVLNGYEPPSTCVMRSLGLRAMNRQNLLEDDKSVTTIARYSDLLQANSGRDG